MNYDEINFHKINRRPVTDTTYQIAAEEWNALGAKVSEMDEAIEDIGTVVSMTEATDSEIIALFN